MDIQAILESLGEVAIEIPRHGLLLAALAAVLAGILGSALAGRAIPGGRALRSLGTLALAGILIAVVVQLSRLHPRMEFAVPQLGLPEQVVTGGQTRVPMAPDGHFWLRASVNGEEAAFLVDTGATLTAVSGDLAARASLAPRQGGIPLRLNTANGTIAAELTTIERMTVGNLEASGIDAVIAPNLGKTNVLGMNFLSRLDSWTVKGDTLILVPKGD